MMRIHNLFSSPMLALKLYINMCRASIPPDFHTYPFVLKVVGNLRVPSMTATLHSLTFKCGLISDVFVPNSIFNVYAQMDCLSDACLLFEENDHNDTVSYNVLIDGFIKAGDIDKARLLFDDMDICDKVTWCTMIAGYAHLKECQEAINLFNTLLYSSCGIRPDNIAVVSVLSACAQLEVLEIGQLVHEYVISHGLQLNSFLSTDLFDLYAKCGVIEVAIDIFESSSKENLFTWNALLMGLAVHGYGRACLDYLSRLLAVLVGCSHTGLIGEARKIFRDMEIIYWVRRELKHYGCMADLFGRAGLIQDVLDMIKQMPIKGDIYVWGALLASCRKHGMVEVAEEAAKNVQLLNPEDSGMYSVMVDIYATSNMWNNVAKTRSFVKAKRIKKNAPCSSIKVNGVTHEFIAGDLNPRTDDISMALSSLVNHQFEASQSWN